MANNRDSEKHLIRLSVKSPKELKYIEVNEGSQIHEVRGEIAKVFNTKADCICMIYSGRILKDGESLKQHRIKDGFTLNVMIKTSLTAVCSTSRSSPDFEAKQSDAMGQEGLGVLGQTGGFGMLGGFGGGPGGLNGLAAGLAADTAGLSAMGGMSGLGGANYAQIHQQLMENPGMMSQMADSPIFQQIMSNPDTVKEIIMANPETRRLMETNPEMQRMFDNPEAFKMCMDMVRNPTFFKACMTGQQDGGASQAIQSLLSGVAAKMGSQSERSTSRTSSTAAVNQTQGTIKADPPIADRTGALPASGQSGALPAAGYSSALSAAGDSSAIPAEAGLHRQRRNSGGGITDILNSPAMQAIVQQMNSNPEMLTNILQTPDMQSLLEHFQASSAVVAESETMSFVSVSNEQRYKSQLEQLASMGFTDRTQNLKSLIDVNGNVDAAIDRILQMTSQ